MKNCSKCKISKPKDSFWTHPRNKDGLNSWCKTCYRDRLRLFRKTPRGIISSAKDTNNKRARRQEQRKLILLHYGEKCACCGEGNELFLSVDHIDGDGNKHRKEIGVSRLYTWLIKNNYPEGFQVLCMNCNWGKMMNNGICPHKNGKRK